MSELVDEDVDVLVLRSPDGRHFLKRECEHYDRSFARVVHMLFVTPPAGCRLVAIAETKGEEKARTGVGNWAWRTRGLNRMMATSCSC